MSRSKRKGAYVEEKLLMKVQRAQMTKDRKPIRTWSRRSTVTTDFVGTTIAIYNGRKHLPVFVTENMVGHKLGEFAPTRTFKKHSTSQDKAKQLAMTQK